MSRRPSSSSLAKTLERERQNHAAERAAWMRDKEKLQRRSHNGVSSLVHDWPDLADLMYVLAEISEAAIPGRAQVIDGDRINHSQSEFISSNGLSLKEGQATKRARDTEKWAAKQLASLVERLEQRRDPEYRPAPSTDKRCRSPKCEGSNKRQKFDQRLCGYCGREF